MLLVPGGQPFSIQLLGGHFSSIIIVPIVLSFYSFKNYGVLTPHVQGHEFDPQYFIKLDMVV